MYYPFVFRDDILREELNIYLKHSSVRQVSDETFKRMSPSTVSRFASGKKDDLTIHQFLALCDVLERDPSKYFQKSLL